MTTLNQLKVDDIVRFSSRDLTIIYPGLWLVTAMGVEWVDLISNKGGSIVHFPKYPMGAEMRNRNLQFNKIRHASMLDKLLLFYDYFSKGLNK
jgi:hypothetical protein